jgi:hypothetical protein
VLKFAREVSFVDFVTAGGSGQKSSRGGGTSLATDLPSPLPRMGVCAWRVRSTKEGDGCLPREAGVPRVDPFPPAPGTEVRPTLSCSRNPPETDADADAVPALHRQCLSRFPRSAAPARSAGLLCSIRSTYGPAYSQEPTRWTVASP